MKGLFYLDTFSISDHHSPENFHSREAIDIGVVRSFLQPTFSLGTNTSCQYRPNILSAYYAILVQEFEGNTSKITQKNR